MFKFFTDLFSGKLSFFNETSSSDSHIEGIDQDGNFHHISKCGNMGVDTSTGDTFIDMGGGFVQRTGSSEIYHSPFESNRESNDPFRSSIDSDDPFIHSHSHSSFDHFGSSSFESSRSSFDDDPFFHHSSDFGSSSSFGSSFDGDSFFHRSSGFGSSFDDDDSFSHRSSGFGSSSSFGSSFDDDKDPFGF